MTLRSLRARAMPTRAASLSLDVQMPEHRSDRVALLELHADSAMVPRQGEVTPMVALFVSTSMMSWPASTTSPTVNGRWTMVASAMHSPSCGMSDGICVA